MRQHLRVITLPVADATTLGVIETTVLQQLDPPLSLAKVAKTPLRIRLSELRKRHASG